MDINKLAETLHQLERKVLPEIKGEVTLKELVEKTGLQEVEVMRALQWLENKELVEVVSSIKELIELDKNGKQYLEKGLPEVRFLKALKKPLSMNEIMKAAGLDKAELNASLGLLKKKGCVEFFEGKIRITAEGKQAVKKEQLEEKFLKTLEHGRDLKGLRDEEKFVYGGFKRRKGLVKTTLVKRKDVKLTDIGERLSKIKVAGNVVDTITSDLLKEKTWEGKKFRRYDIKINVPSITGGKRHFLNEAAAYVKKIWLEMGFEEMEGSFVQTSFWDLDSLFVPQDHPARQMQDTFYLKDPDKGALPGFMKKVKAVHENGGDTGSTGWGGEWSVEKAKENLLRTHTTVLSAQTISKLKESDLPAKFFSVGKVFRNETLDWKHLFEFDQVEGIVVDPDANFSHLKGYLREFYQKMGFPDVRMRPAHFPYVEPGIEIDVLHPVKRQWVELGGAGIFRPEVVKPLLGMDVPVLAWGQGLGRIVSEFYKITDIRDYHKNDLKQLKSMRAWLKF